MFENIHQLRIKSNAFVANINLHVAEVIQQSEKDLVELNQKQLQKSKLVNDQDITPLYSDAYAKRKGYRKPDGYLTGEMYREMFVSANENDNSFSISSYAPHTEMFASRYGDVFGIGDSNIKIAQSKLVPLLRLKFEKLVLS